MGHLRGHCGNATEHHVIMVPGHQHVGVMLQNIRICLSPDITVRITHRGLRGGCGGEVSGPGAGHPLIMGTLPDISPTQHHGNITGHNTMGTQDNILRPVSHSSSSLIVFLMPFIIWIKTTIKACCLFHFSCRL